MKHFCKEIVRHTKNAAIISLAQITHYTLLNFRVSRDQKILSQTIRALWNVTIEIMKSFLSHLWY